MVGSVLHGLGQRNIFGEARGVAQLAGGCLGHANIDPREGALL